MRAGRAIPPLPIGPTLKPQMFVITVGQVDPAASLEDGETKDGGALIVDPDGVGGWVGLGLGVGWGGWVGGWVQMCSFSPRSD